MALQASPHLLTPTIHGRPALEALHNAVVEAKGNDALAPVTVIVPSNFVGLSARRALGGGQFGPITGSSAGIAGVSFLTVYRLAELYGAAELAATGRRPVSTPVIAASLRRVLATTPGYFSRVAEHPTTERRLVNAHRELSDLDEADLLSLAALSPRAAEVVRIHRSTRDLLGAGWYQEQDLLRYACTAVEASAAVADSLGSVIVFLPDRLSAVRAQLLRSIMDVAPTRVIVGLTGVPEADRSVEEAIASLGFDPPTVPARGQDSAAEIEVLSVSDADDEVRHVVRGIIAAASDGVAFDRMAVVYASVDPYVRLVHDHFGAAEIPFNGSALETLAESVPGRVLRRLLALPDRDYRREDVIGLLSSSPLLWHGHAVPSRAWDQVSRDAGVVKGADQWRDRLGTFIDDAVSTIDRLGDDPEHEWRVRRHQRSAERARQLRDFIVELSSELARGAAMSGWAQRARWCQRLLRQFLGERAYWPPDQHRLADRLGQILDSLASLDEVEPSVTLAVFRRTLDLELDGGLGRVGSFGNGVLVGPASVTLGLDLDRVWVLGMSEGTFPSRPRDDSLLPDRERRQIAALALRSDRTGEEHRHFLTSLAAVGTDGTATLLFPRGDLRQSSQRAPSRWLVEAARTKAGVQHMSGSDFDRLDEDWIHEVPSFAAGVVAAPFPATTQEYELKSLVYHLRAHGDVKDHALLAVGRPLSAGDAMQRARAGTNFTRFDGNLAGLDIPVPGANQRATSATSLETWARCPHQYFVRYLLGVDPLDTPEQRLRIDALSKGSLLHEVLERFIDEQLEAYGEGRAQWNSTTRDRLHELAREEFETARARGLTGEALYWRRDQVLLRRDLDHYFEVDRDRCLQDIRPLDTELGFGLRDSDPISVDLPSGRTISLRGSIDRVDERSDGSLLVTDYKSGRHFKVDGDDPDAGGTRLQLVLYAMAARSVYNRTDVDVYSGYWFLRRDARKTFEGYQVTPVLQRSVIQTVSTIVEGVAEGVFPLHPDDTTRGGWVGCHYCDPDGLGVADARRRFVKLSTDPQVARYVSLAEPDLLPAPALPHIEEQGQP